MKKATLERLQPGTDRTCRVHFRRERYMQCAPPRGTLSTTTINFHQFRQHVQFSRWSELLAFRTSGWTYRSCGLATNDHPSRPYPLSRVQGNNSLLANRLCVLPLEFRNRMPHLIASLLDRNRGTDRIMSPCGASPLSAEILSFCLKEVICDDHPDQDRIQLRLLVSRYLRYM